MTRLSSTPQLLALLVTLVGGGLGSVPEVRAGDAQDQLDGYRLCLRAASRQLPGLSDGPEYFINEGPRRRRYFINGTAWADDGGRRAIRVACETSRSGHRLVSLDIGAGRYARAAGSGQLIVASH